MARRWYQTIEIDDVDQVFEDHKRLTSNYWNEGKFNNFVAPLLPDQRRTFLEIGCNAGLFLKMAQDNGFDRAVGVEGNSRIFQQSVQYRNSVNGDWLLVEGAAGHDSLLEKLPLADVVLISNMHYYLPVHEFAKMIDELKNRCLYCIVVSARSKRRQGNAAWDLNHVRGYFEDWEEIRLIDNLGIQDPCMRPQMYGVLFKSNLVATNVDDIFDPWWEAAKVETHRSFGLAQTMENFFARILNNELFELEDHPFFHYWRTRQPKRSDEWIINLMNRKKELALNIQKNGMKTPVYISKKGKVLDGIHRIVIAKLLEHEYILSRII